MGKKRILTSKFSLLSIGDTGAIWIACLVGSNRRVRHLLVNQDSLGRVRFQQASLSYGTSLGTHQRRFTVGAQPTIQRDETAFSEKWMELGIIMLSRINQTETNTACFLTCGIYIQTI